MMQVVTSGTTFMGHPAMVMTCHTTVATLCAEVFKHRHGVKCPTCGVQTPAFTKKRGQEKF